ncbi:FG-GAP repeat domain-containing protein [Streptomyces sp. NPDC055078]
MTLAALLTALLTACTSDPGGGGAPADAKNGDTRPLADKAARAQRPVPSGTGSALPDDFNGDGHRDLVLNDLVKAPDQTHGDDAGIGIVYGSGGPRPLDPSVNRLLTPRANAAAVEGTVPAAFDAEASCDLDRDGFADLVVMTDPPYNGVGRPPVPVQLLFGSPAGLRGKAVVLRIPEEAHHGNGWPEQPVCGDFDGDGSPDLVVTASEGRLGFLRGPFTRAGAPRAATSVVEGGGPALSAPRSRADVNRDGYDDLVVSATPVSLGAAARGTLLLGGPKGPDRPGGAYRAKALPVPPTTLSGTSGTSGGRTQFVRYADFDGDKRRDTVTRTYRGERTDVVTVHTKGDRPLMNFSTSIFLR